MKLEQQVVSLELAKKLKELGVKQESYFSYAEGEEDGRYTLEIVKSPGTYSATYYSAYTVAEFGELLPYGITKENNSYMLSINKEDDGWEVYYNYYYYELIDCFLEKSNKMADAMAKMLVYLLENNLISTSRE